MEDLNSQFEKAADGAKSLPGKPSNDTLLNIYALYKQATVGDINTSNPYHSLRKARHPRSEGKSQMECLGEIEGQESRRC